MRPERSLWLERTGFVGLPGGISAERLFWLLIGLVLLSGFNGSAAPASPFAVNGTMVFSNEVAWVTLDFRVPPDHVLYADRLAFIDGADSPLRPVSIEKPEMHLDGVSGQQKPVYNKSFSATLKIESPLPQSLLVKLQGCSNSACYFPEKHLFTVTSTGLLARIERDMESDSPAASMLQSQIGTNGFKITGRQTGYVPKKAFLGFLRQSKTGQGPNPDAVAKFARLGPGLSLLLIVLGGVGLNLTPCVLPLIPINLAIIGAGARASSRQRGFALGGTYGLGMALAYGVLGVVVVLTGSKFGTLNSSAWFNLGIAAVFLLMSLAMFDLINLDFSRLQGRIGGAGSSSKSQFILALSMGAMAALLAGACVAPVVISVLLLAAHLYGKGALAGLLLPFLLGLGMALPWPFAGAGLSFLPKPGSWMKWVKYSFGVLILLFVGYYGHVAFRIFESDLELSAVKSNPSITTSEAAAANSALLAALERSKQENKPLLIDFAASWCKNCLAMDSTVFAADEVKQQLSEFVVIRYSAEKPNESPAKEVLDRFGVMGLPTYIVLRPEKEQ
ncbi:MAG TPA: cytochrome c biogenesis protein CcdA [Patescibacteria group bacterium]|nr:cytochrome c biogenesis protein CcdA [Patescibacteria group bacterium]